MRFRPCIDIHNGKVKQIVGGSLSDRGDAAKENFVSDMEADSYARLYFALGLTGGHVILLNPEGSPQYAATRAQALKALAAAPGTLQVGGGIRPDNAGDYLAAGASHVIVTSYVFREGKIAWDHLRQMEEAVGRNHLVLDLSCRRDTTGAYRIVTDRWQRWTDVVLCPETMERLAGSCSEFLIHAADVEGQVSGPEEELIRLLGSWDGIPVTYAGGIASFHDLETLKREGRGRVDVTIGSALDLFGGTLPLRDVLQYISQEEQQE